MAALELDPLFLKALTLLRSKSRESTDQLKSLLDEVLGKKTKTASGKTEGDGEDKPVRKKEDKESKLSLIIKKSASVDDRKGAIKRPLDKHASQSKTDAGPVKKLKVDASKKAPAIRRPVIDDSDDEADEVFEMKKPPSDVINISSDSDDRDDRGRGGSKKTAVQEEEEEEERDSTDMDDFALELGLACVVCKKMDVSAKNQLIECQECHNLYHQFCHKPPVTDVDDPRLVWYCAKCQRNMRKSVDKKPMRSSASLSDLSSSSSLEKKMGEHTMNLFKRSEPKTPPVSSVGKSHQPFTGFAAFAANVSGKGSSSSAKSGSVSSKPSTIIGKSNIRVNMSGGPTKSGSSSSRTIVSKFKSSSSESRSPSPQPTAGPSKGKGGGGGGVVKNLPQASQASAMKRLQMMKRKASKR